MNIYAMRTRGAVYKYERQMHTAVPLGLHILTADSPCECYRYQRFCKSAVCFCITRSIKDRSVAYCLRRTFSRLISKYDADDKRSIKELWRQLTSKWRLLYPAVLRGDSHGRNLRT